MAGYTRNDGPNNISDGNVINSSDLDGEYDAIEAAFNNSTGHTHDGTAAEGAPIEVVGPAQDLVVTAAKVEPKTDNTLDLGSSTKEFKDLYIDGTAYIDGLGENILVATDKAIQFRDSGLSINSSADGQLDIDADTELELTAPTMDINASTTVTVDTADLVITGDTSATGAVDITGDLDVDNINIDGNAITSTDTNGDITISPNGTGTVVIDTDLDVDNININGNAITSTDTNGNIALTPDGTGEVDISKVDIDSGTIDGVTIGGASAGAGTFTTITGSGDMNIDSGTLFVDASANAVGIGTTSPSTHLHIQAPEETAKLRLQRSGSTNASDADLGEIEFFNSDGTSDGPNVSAKVTASTYTGAGAGGQLKFHTHDGTEAGGEGSDPVERMRIDGIGNVGIGTSSPDKLVHIVGSEGATTFSSYGARDFLVVENNQNTNIQIISNSANSGNILFSDESASARGLIAYSHANDTLAFDTAGSEAMRIDSSGNVGIGTQSPNAALEIISGTDNANTLLLCDTLTTSTVDGFVTIPHGNSGTEEPLHVIQGRVESGTDSRILIGGSHLTTTYNVANKIQFYTASGITTTPVKAGEFDSSANFKFNSGYGSVATAYGCRAWVNFNGTGTVAIRDDGNVSSVGDNGTGDFTVNFSTAMPDANYAAVASGRNSQGYATAALAQQFSTSLRVQSYAGGSLLDVTHNSIAIIR